MSPWTVVHVFTPYRQGLPYTLCTIIDQSDFWNEAIEFQSYKVKGQGRSKKLFLYFVDSSVIRQVNAMTPIETNGYKVKGQGQIEVWQIIDQANAMSQVEFQGCKVKCQGIKLMFDK